MEEEPNIDVEFMSKVKKYWVDIKEAAVEQIFLAEQSIISNHSLIDLASKMVVEEEEKE